MLLIETHIQALLDIVLRPPVVVPLLHKHLPDFLFDLGVQEKQTLLHGAGVFGFNFLDDVHVQLELFLCPGKVVHAHPNPAKGGLILLLVLLLQLEQHLEHVDGPERGLDMANLHDKRVVDGRLQMLHLLLVGGKDVLQVDLLVHHGFILFAVSPIVVLNLPELVR